MTTALAENEPRADPAREKRIRNNIIYIEEYDDDDDGDEGWFAGDMRPVSQGRGWSRI